jgi:hypothetical protein
LRRTIDVARFFKPPDAGWKARATLFHIEETNEDEKCFLKTNV